MFEIHKKSSSSNLIFQTRFFKNQLQGVKLFKRIKSEKISRNKQIKKAFCFQNYVDFFLFKQIVLEISFFLQILSIQPQISKVSSHSMSEQFSKQNTELDNKSW